MEARTASKRSMMMSEEDQHLLERHRPELMQCIELEGSLLLACLRAEGALTEQQEQVIEV